MTRAWGYNLTVLANESCTFICIFSQILATKYRGSRLVVSCNHRFLNNLFSASTLTLIHHLRNGILQNLLEVCFMWLETVFLSELVVKFPASHDHTCDTLVVDISTIMIPCSTWCSSSRTIMMLRTLGSRSGHPIRFRYCIVSRSYSQQTTTTIPQWSDKIQG